MESSSERACVLVVMDANRRKSGVEALEWALKSVVRPKDTVIALGVLIECWRKNSCFPFLTGIGISGRCKLGLCQILSRVRHRHIMNIVGYCYADDSVFLLCDCPCMDTVEVNLQCDDLAKVFGWKSRWCVALEIGGSLSYLHEECVDGPIVHLSVCSAHVVSTQGNSAMATPLLENGSLSQLMDHRLTDSSDMEVVNHMANAALCCLKNVKGRKLSMSEVLAVVRGDELALSKYGFSE